MKRLITENYTNPYQLLCKRSLETIISIAVIAISSFALGCSSAPSGTKEPIPTMEAIPNDPAAPTTSPLASFKKPSERNRWMVINDGVMGGKSESDLRRQPDSATFLGTVSAENGGGFASIRSVVARPVAGGLKAISLRVRGDGKRYQFRIRTNTLWDGASYMRTFDTKAGIWQDLVLPLSEFQASFRGRLLSDVAPLTSREIQQIGFLIADEQYGNFALEIDSISIR